MADLYANFSALKSAQLYQTDYHILCGYKKPSLIAIAIHGGGIEGGTSELAVEFANLLGNSYYCFEGWKSSGNTDLHITATNFDEPNALKMVLLSETTISFHGYTDSVDPTKQLTRIGGLDYALRDRIRQELNLAGFSTEFIPDNDPVAGANINNIVNKNKSGKGVQLEISSGLRDTFFTTNTVAGRRTSKTPVFYQYINAIKNVF